MTAYLAVGISSFLAGVAVAWLLTRRNSSNSRKQFNTTNLNRFNFDKQKQYEKEGRKFPFSY